MILLHGTTPPLQKVHALLHTSRGFQGLAQLGHDAVYVGWPVEKLQQMSAYKVPLGKPIKPTGFCCSTSHFL